MQRHLHEARTADSVLDDPKRPLRRKRVRRRITEARIECDVIVWRVETGVVENIEGLHVKTQVEPLSEFKILEHGYIHAGLERADEDVAAGGSKSRFHVVAERNSIYRRVRCQQGNSKRRRIEDRFAR